MFTPLAVDIVPHPTRRLIVVDLENVVGGALLNARAADWATTLVLDAVAPVPGDLVVIGVAHNGLMCAGCAWPNLRYVLGSGESGADLALLEVLDENVPARFSEVVIVSGDGIFAEKAADLGAAGVRVTVVSRPSRLARRLRMVVQDTHLLPEPACPGLVDDAA